MGKTYIRFIGYLQAIAIILVVLGHSLHLYPDGDNGRSTLAYRLIYSFHMPLFMFVSGFLLALTTDPSLRQRTSANVRRFISTKISRLMVPYMVLTAVTFVPRSMMSSLADDPVTLNLSNFLGAFYRPELLPIPYFWFLQSAFTLLIAVFLIRWLLSRCKVSEGASDILLISVSAILLASDTDTTVFSLNMSARMCLFLTAGIVYCHYYRTLDRLVPWHRPLFIFSQAAVWLLLFFLLEGTVWMFLCSLAGISMAIGVAKYIEYRNLTFLDRLTGANYLIFLLSWYFNVFFQQILSHYVTLPWYVHTTLSLTAGILIPAWFYHFMMRHPDNRFVSLSALVFGQKIK